MVFSSSVFLFLFLPVLLGLYAICPRRGRNALLLVASLLFYAWGAPAMVLVMLASIAINYLLGLWADRAHETWQARWVLVVTLAINLGLLGYYKYAVFLSESIRSLLAHAGIEWVGLRSVELPIGISFFTFHALSYVTDVHRRKFRAQRNPINLALYITLFPQLIAGPIVRYCDIAAQIVERRTTLAGFALGVERFLIGLAKKLLIANAVAPVADAVFDIPNADLTAPLAWLGVVCYSLQIYFDFSGYSDMAIGLGKMFGFDFLENFNYPYVARSVTDFWRRWHISLSTWFRDYLYIPLGGNRRGPARNYANLVTVFFLCGLWHGASWTFALWGLYHGLFLVLEKWGLSKVVARLWSPLAHTYTLLVVMVGWVLFRADSLAHAGNILTAMCGLGSGAGLEYHVGLYLDRGLILALAAGVIGSTPWLPAARHEIERLRAAWQQSPAAGTALEALLSVGRFSALATLLLATAMVMSASTYNPFIYFRF